MMTIGVAPHNEMKVLLFTVTHEFLKFPCWWRFLGIVRQIGGTGNQTLREGLVKVLKFLFQVSR
jgi:hypothetical protein